MATGSDKLEKYIKNNVSGIQIDTVTSKRRIIPRNEEYQYDVILLSAVLPGTEDMRDIIFETQRESNCRIIYFAGATKLPDLIDIFMLGVKDIICEPIDPRAVISAINRPATYGEAVSVLKVMPAQSGTNIKRMSNKIKSSPDAPPEVSPEAEEILKGMLKLLRQEPGGTFEESLLNLEQGINDIITQKN